MFHCHSHFFLPVVLFRDRGWEMQRNKQRKQAKNSVTFTMKRSINDATWVHRMVFGHLAISKTRHKPTHRYNYQALPVPPAPPPMIITSLKEELLATTWLVGSFLVAKWLKKPKVVSFSLVRCCGMILNSLFFTAHVKIVFIWYNDSLEWQCRERWLRCCDGVFQWSSCYRTHASLSWLPASIR